MKKVSKVVFISDELEGCFYSLDKKDFVRKSIEKAIYKLKNNSTCGIHVSKKLIPKEYIKEYKINNLWKLNMSKGWRLLYTIAPDGEVEIISAILDWLKHKDYEKKMKYKVK